MNFVYAHLNRVIRARDLNMIYVAGPGHGGPELVANVYLEGTYSEVYPNVSADARRDAPACSSSSRFPAASPATSPRRHRDRSTRAASSGTPCRTRTAPRSTTRTSSSPASIGDGEAETGPLATSWHSNKFLNPATDGAVLPILHLNGYKIANPTVLARIGDDELTSLLTGYGYQPLIVAGSDPHEMHESMARTLDVALDAIAEIQTTARIASRPPARARAGR